MTRCCFHMYQESLADFVLDGDVQPIGGYVLSPGCFALKKYASPE